MSDYQEKYQKIRKQLLGFALLLLIIAAIAPWIITNKSNQQTLTDSSVYTIDLSDRSKNSNNEMASGLENGDAVNMPRLPSVTADFEKENKAMAEGLGKVSQATAPASKEEINSQTGLDTQSTATLAKTKLKSEDRKYTIQLVALKNKQKIDELTALLLLHNYEVQVTPKKPEPNQVIKLQLGPYAKKEQAEQVVIDLKNLTKLEGKILAN